jgi:hypothetical protein
MTTLTPDDPFPRLISDGSQQKNLPSLTLLRAAFRKNNRRDLPS